MSRLNFMEEQELAIQTIAEELARLERLVLKGERIAPELAPVFESCVKQAIRIQAAVARNNTAMSRHNRTRGIERRASAKGKTRRSELAGQPR